MDKTPKGETMTFNNPVKKKYEKPIAILQKNMVFPFANIDKRNSKYVCRQCSSCHGCRGCGGGN